MSWKYTSPFNYSVFDHAISAPIAQRIYNEMSALDTSGFYKYDNIFERKLAEDRWQNLPTTIRIFLSWTLTKPFIEQMEEISGIKGLIPDYNFLGGGIHIHKDQGILKPHKDFTLHRSMGLIRRLNYIVYFNKNYVKEWGGQLELWNKEMTECTKIEPSYNKAVLFETPNNIHGFSEPWNAPKSINRKSLAIYLYTTPTLEDLKKTHLSTQFIKRPDEETTEEIESLREKRNKGRL